MNKTIQEAAIEFSKDGGPFSIHEQNYRYMFENGAEMFQLKWKLISTLPKKDEEECIILTKDNLVSFGNCLFIKKSPAITHYILLSDLLNLSKEEE